MSAPPPKPPPPDEPEPSALPATPPHAVPLPPTDGTAWYRQSHRQESHRQESQHRQPHYAGSFGAIGIDLGSTKSVAAVLEAGVPVVIPNSEGARTTPSVVAFAQDGWVLVGEVARRQAITNPDRTIRSVKRHMGTNWSVDIDGKAYNSQEISARTLQKLKRDAEAYMGGVVTQAVITVPAYFDDAQRTATKEAGEVAGLKVLRITSEPTAAALAYGFCQDDADQTVLVFDLGGGSLSVSILEIGDGVFEVKATNGDTSLGGDDWDECVINWLVATFRGAHGIDLSKDNMAMQRLKEAAETAKVELSQAQQTQINLPFLATTENRPLHLVELLTRAKFQELTSDLLQRCKVPLERAITDACMSKNDLEHIILVGGSTRMPAVADMITDLMGEKAHKGVNPDEVVAMGAAIQAGVLMGNVKDVLLLDVTPLSLGIETAGGVMTKLIERNTTIPTRRTEVFTTAEDNQPSVEIHVLQGEREMSSYNKTLGKFQLVDLPPAPQGVPQVEVTIDIDGNGIVNVAAKDRATNKEQSITITGQSSLSKDQITRMMRDAEAHADSVARKPAPKPAANAPSARPSGRPSAPPDQEQPPPPSEATIAAILAVLPAMDVCDLAAMEADEELATTRVELVRVLDRLGAVRIDTADVPFDPTVHEAVSHELDDQSPQPMVSKVVRSGYCCGERVLRPALVAVRG